MPGSSDTKVCSNTDFKGGSDWDSNTDIQIKLVYTKDDQRTHTSKTNLQLISVPDSSDTRESSDDESDWDSDTDALDQYGREEFIGNNQSKITIRAKVMNNLKKTSADKKDGNKLSCKPVSVNIDKSQFKKDDSDCYNDRSDWDDDSCASLPARNIKQINVDSGNTKFLPNNNSTCNTASKVDTAKRNEVTSKIKENSSVPNRVKTNDISVNKCTQPKSPIDTDAEASDWDDVNSIMNTSTKNSKEGICQKSASKSFGNNKQDTIVNNGKTKDIEAALKGHTKVHSIMSSVTTSNVRSERPPKTCLDTDDEDSDWDNDSDILGVKQLVVNAVKDEQTSEPNRFVDIMNIGCKSNETTKDVASENTYSKDNLVLSKRTTDNVNKSPVKKTVFPKTCLDNDDDLSEWDDESVNSIENIQLDDPKPITKDIGSNGTANNVCIEKKKHVGVKVAFSEENGIQPYTLNDDDKKESVKKIALPQICLDTDEDSSDWDDELDVSVVKQSLRNEVNDVQTSKPKTFFSIENHGRLSNETMLDSIVENTRPEDLLLSNSTADNINKRSINEYVLPKTCIDTDGEPSDWDDESVMSSKNVPSEHNDESIGHKCSSKHVAGFCAMTTVVQSNEIQPEHRIEKTMVSNVTAGNGRSVPTRAFPKTCIDTDDEASDWDDDSVNHCAVIPPHHDKRNSDKKSAPTKISCTDYGICSNKQKHTEETLMLHPNANLIKSNKSSDRTNDRSVPTRALPKTCIDTDDEASDWNDDSENHCEVIPSQYDKRNGDKNASPTDTSGTDYGICSNKRKDTEEILKLHPNANLIKSSLSSDRTNDRTVHTHDLPQTCIDTDDEASDWDDDSVSSCTVLPAQDNGRHDDQSSVSKEHDIPEIGDNACYEKTKEKDLLNIHHIENSTLCIKSRNITNKRSANEKCLSKTRLDTEDKSRDWNDDATNSKTNILLERNADNGTHTGALQDVGTYKNDERVIVEIKNSESVKSHLKPNTLPRKCCTGDFVDKDTSKHDKSQLRHANCIKRRDNIGTDILVDDTIHNDTKTLVSADNKNSDNNESFSEGLPNKNVANVKAFGRSNDIRTFYVKKEHRHMESKGHIFIFNASIPDASTGSDNDYISNQENASNGVSNTHLDSISNEITKLKSHFSNGIMPAKVNGKILAGEGNKTSAKVLQVSRQHHIDIAPIVKSDRCTRVLNDAVSNHSFNFESGSNYSNGDEAVHRDIGLNILDKTNPGKVKQVLDIFGKGSKDKGFQRVHIINSQERYLHRKSPEDICSKQNQCQDVHEKVATTKRMQSEKIFTNKVNAYLNNSYKNDDVDIATQSKGCFTYVKHKKESTDRDMNEFNRINYDESYKPEHECCKTCYIDKKSQVADTCCEDVCKDMNHPTCLNSNGPCIINIQNLVMHINQVQDTLTTDKIACCEGRYTTSAKESTFENGYRSNVSIPNKSVPDVPVFSTKDIPLQTVRNKEWIVGKRNKRKEAEPCVIDTDDTSTWRHMNSPSVQSVYSKCFPTQEVSQERINPFSASTVTELHTNERRTGVKRKWQKFREKYHKNNVKLIQSTCEFTSDLKPGYDNKDTKDTRDSNVQRIEKEANGVQNKVNPKVKKTVRFAEPEYNQSVLSMFFQSENNSLSTDKCQGENTTQISEQSDGLVTKLVNLIRREIDEVLDNKLDSIKFVGIENVEHLHQFDCQADVRDLYSEVKPEYLSMIDVKEERIVKTDNTRINKDSVRVVTKNGKEKKRRKINQDF
ncbi:hypothetical protein ACF0H5_020869 [Mactra antiquata]